VDVRHAERTLSATTLRAPIAGTVLSIAGTAGAPVGTGNGGFITLGDLTDLQVRALFSLGDADRLKVGQRATIGLGMSADGRYTGTVTGIDPAATTSGNLARVGVNISLDDSPAGVLIGMSATAEVVTAQAQSALYVPAGAVRSKPDGTATVLVRHDGRTMARTVRLGVRSDRYVAVIGGLSSGDHVVMPTGTDSDGFPDGAFPGA
jgi:RND family efflux transporter MFP subunit